MSIYVTYALYMITQVMHACCTTQVLHNHGKKDVFDIVKNLNLPLEHGDLSLLNELQALGLHSRRYKVTLGKKGGLEFRHLILPKSLPHFS